MTERITGRRWMAIRKQILDASDICHICGHSGADAVDHVVPLARGGTNERGNLRPAHHNTPPRCNMRKADNEWAPIIRHSSSLNRG